MNAKQKRKIAEWSNIGFSGVKKKKETGEVFGRENRLMIRSSTIKAKLAARRPKMKMTMAGGIGGGIRRVRKVEAS